MSLQVEKLEKNMAKLTVEVPAEQFEAALKTSYNKNKNKFNIPGFRKGKAPQAMIEKMYGVGVFYEDAVDEAINASYPDAAKESGLEIVSRPEISIEQVEKGKSFIYVATVATKPEVTLGEYKGIEVEKAKPEVTDADVEAELKKVQEQNSRLVSVEDRAVADGDQTVIDFEGFVDGEAFQGGKAEDYSLTIGSGSFIPGFEDQLIGAKIGEEKEVNVTFPEEYHEASLKGKPAVFKCTVKEIKVKELPAADDEFAKDVSEFDTLAEYKDDIRSKLVEKKEAQAKREKQNKAVDKAVANAQMEIPDAMVTEQVRRMADDFAKRLQSQGLTVEQYMQFTGMTADKLLEQMRPEALKRIQNSLVLEAIAKAENIEVSDEKVNEEIEKMAAAYKMEADKLKELIGDAEKEQMKSDLAIQAAVDMITDAAVEVEAAKEEEKTEE